jgi:predicted PurR-regulated permease PerM
MQLKNYNIYFFFLLLAGVSWLIYFILKPFLVPFIVAVIFSQLFYSTYQWLFRLTGNRKGISSGLVCLLIMVIIIVPLIFVANLVVGEARTLINGFSAGMPAINALAQRISSSYFFSQLHVTNAISQDTMLSFLKSAAQSILGIIQGTYLGAAHLLFAFFIMFFSVFYLLIDGKKFLEIIMKLSPLKNKYEERMIERFTSISRATLKGTSLIAILQGFIGSILFFLAGVSSPVLLGILMTISSVIPPIGSALIWFPVGLVMILLGYPMKGIAIWIVGAVVISTVDNVLKQKLIGKDVEMHPLLILFSTLGGIFVFGMAGFVVGPIIMALGLALLEIYFLEFKEQLEEFNQ